MATSKQHNLFINCLEEIAIQLDFPVAELVMVFVLPIDKIMNFQVPKNLIQSKVVKYFFTTSPSPSPDVLINISDKSKKGRKMKDTK